MPRIKEFWASKVVPGGIGISVMGWNVASRSASPSIALGAVVSVRLVVLSQACATNKTILANTTKPEIGCCNEIIPLSAHFGKNMSEGHDSEFCPRNEC